MHIWPLTLVQDNRMSDAHARGEGATNPFNESPSPTIGVGHLKVENLQLPIIAMVPILSLSLVPLILSNNIRQHDLRRTILVSELNIQRNNHHFSTPIPMITLLWTT